MRAIVTGATGLLGRHLVEQLVQDGWTVTALVRETSNRTPLEKYGIPLRAVNLTHAPLDAKIFKKADVVFHCAAAVGDWGSWEFFSENTLDATVNVCRAMAEARCPRLVHISTVGVYGRPATTEPVVEKGRVSRKAIWRWNYYARAKLEAEAAMWMHSAGLEGGEPFDATVLRPAMIYGRGDRALVGRIAPLLKQKKIRFLGDPRTTLPLVHARDVAAAAVLAAGEKGVRQTFNVVNPEPVTQEVFFNSIAELVGAPLVKSGIPFAPAYAAGFGCEIAGRLLMLKNPPPLTRYRVFLFGQQRHYSIEKIQSTLGWKPQMSFKEGIREALS